MLFMGDERRFFVKLAGGGWYSSSSVSSSSTVMMSGAALDGPGSALAPKKSRIGRCVERADALFLVVERVSVGEEAKASS